MKNIIIILLNVPYNAQIQRYIEFFFFGRFYVAPVAILSFVVSCGGSGAEDGFFISQL